MQTQIKPSLNPRLWQKDHHEYIKLKQGAKTIPLTLLERQQEALGNPNAPDECRG